MAATIKIGTGTEKAGTSFVIPNPMHAVDFGDIRGQEACKRAMLIAIAGMHSITLIGPSGWGKSLLASAARRVSEGFDQHRDMIHELTVPSPDAARLEWIQNIPTAPRLAMIHVEVPPVPFRELTGRNRGTDSAYIAAKLAEVKVFREGEGKTADLSLGDESILLGKQACGELGLTARDFHACIKVARTISNLEQSPRIQCVHLAEAVQYRLLDRKS